MDNNAAVMVRAALIMNARDSKKQGMELLEKMIRDNSRRQNEIYLKLFPPVRPDRDATHISSLIDKKSAELMRLHDAIKTHEADLNASVSLSQLRKDCATTYAELERLRSLLSPIRILPVELLGEIFLLASATKKASLSTLIITHVCASWRNIAISKPELWSSLKLEPHHFSSGSRDIFSLAKLWLERSGNQPLRLHIRPEDNPMEIPTGPTPDDLFIQLVHLYCPHFARWQDIFLAYPRFFADDEELFSQIPPDASFRCLESFGLISDGISTSDMTNFPPLLTRAPKLTKVTWVVGLSDRDPSFSYAQLTRLTVGGQYSLERALIMLYYGTDLRSVEFKVSIKRIDIATDFVPVVNESLQQLALTCMGNASVFFELLTLPALQDLQITKAHSWLDTTISWLRQGTFIEFLSRSKCRLTNLVIVDFIMTSEELVILLRLSPSLVRFHIESFRARFVTNRVLEALVYPAEDSVALVSPDAADSSLVICPFLRQLYIVGCLSATDGILARMVESRCPPPPGLARLELGVFGLDSTKSPGDYSRILALNGIHDNVDFTILDESIGSTDGG